MITEGKWINGYGNGVTGPTTPNCDGPTVCESIAYKKWKDEGCKGDSPPDQHTVVSCNTQTIAIVPTIEPEGEDNAALIAAAPQLLAACKAIKEIRDSNEPAGLNEVDNILEAAIELAEKKT